MTKAYVPIAYRPAAKIGANIIFKVYASNWLLWNQGIDTVMKLKERLNLILTVTTCDHTMWEFSVWKLCQGLEHTKNLVFYSMNDPICRPEMMQECLNSWSNLGLDYEVKYWEESAHAAHLIYHREEYLSTFNSFYGKTSK